MDLNAPEYVKKALGSLDEEERMADEHMHK
jgi:hypothetical protein